MPTPHTGELQPSGKPLWVFDSAGNLFLLGNLFVNGLVPVSQGGTGAPLPAVSSTGALTLSGSSPRGMLFIANSVGTSQNPGNVTIQAPTNTDGSLAIFVSGDTSARWTVRADGLMKWGPGNASQDTTLQRATGGGLTLTQPSTMVQTIGGVLQATSSQTTIANTAALSTLQTFTVPANDPQAGAVYRVAGYGVFSVTGTPTLTFALYWGGTGGTQLISIPAVTAAAGITNAPFYYEGLLNFYTATTVMVRLRLTVDTSTATDAVATFLNCTAATVTVTTNANSALAMGFTWSAASASNTISLNGGMIERLA